QVAPAPMSPAVRQRSAWPARRDAVGCGWAGLRLLRVRCRRAKQPILEIRRAIVPHSPACCMTDRNSMAMNEIATTDPSLEELDRLTELAEDVIRRAQAAGASQAEVSASIDTGLGVNVRLGEVETVERTRDRGFGLTVYFGQRKGTASTADLNPDSVQATIDQACAIARHTEDDVCAGLAEADRMARDFPDLDLWHPWHVDVAGAADLGREIEAAGRDMTGITNSEGASVQAGSSLGVYANSHGF